MQIERGGPGHVGGSHRCAVPGGGRGIAADHRRLNAGTWRKYIDTGAVVGEGRADIRRGRGSHSQGFAGPGGRRIARIPVVVARSHHKSDPCLDGTTHRSIQRGRAATAQTHICHSGQLSVGRHPVNARNHPRPGAVSITVQHPHRMDRHPFGDSVGRAAHCPRDVGSVAVAVIHTQTVADGCCAVAHPSRKFVVGGAQTRVQNICVDTRPVHGIGVGTVQRQGALVDPIQSPSG